jgi:hypothetical protein
VGMKPKTIEERLWAKVDRSGGPDACWPWTGPVNKGGYGQIQRNGKTIGVHRAAYEIAHGEIPEGMSVCHNCPGGDNPRCCNEGHLWLGTHRENIHDRDRKGRAFLTLGELSGKTKFTEEDILRIRQLASEGLTFRRIAKIYDVTPTGISLIVRRINWKHVA